MTTLDQITNFLGTKRLAIVGVSRNPKDFSRSLFREFLRRGYDAVPVHPAAGEIEGLRCFESLRQVAPPVEAALLMTSPTATEQVVRDCAKAGVSRVWMYRAMGAGAVSGEAVRYCESQGLDVIAGECPWMFLQRSGFPHRLHGLFRKVTGRYPGISSRNTCQAGR